MNLLLQEAARWLSWVGIHSPSPIVLGVTLLLAAQSVQLLLLVAYMVVYRIWRKGIDAYVSRRSSVWRDRIIAAMLDTPEREFFAVSWPDGAIARREMLNQIGGLRGPERAVLLRWYRAAGFLERDLEELRALRWWKRLRAVIAIEQLEAPEAGPRLAHMLEDLDPLVALEAHRALSRLAYPGKTELLLASLARRAPGRRDALAEVLHQLAQEDLPRVLRFLEQECHAESGRAAAAVMGMLHATDAVPVLIRLLERRPALADDVVEEFIAALGRIGDPRAMRPLRGYLENPTAALRARAIFALLDLGDPVIRARANLIDDPEFEVQRAIQFARHGDSSGKEGLGQ